MGQLYDVQPTPTHSDYVAAARDLLRRQRKRALVIVITNFRDEDSTELAHALRLLRPRHLVLLASLRERIVGELMAQPLTSGDAVDRRRQRAPLRTVAPRRVQPPRDRRGADGRRRTRAPRRRAGQPLSRGQARRVDLTLVKGQGAGDKDKKDYEIQVTTTQRNTQPSPRRSNSIE